MSVRERRNRKDRRGKTPEQIRRGQRAHELAYEQAIEGQDMLSLRPGGYLTADTIRSAFDALWNETRMPRPIGVPPA